MEYQGETIVEPQDLPRDAKRLREIEQLTGLGYGSMHNWVRKHGMPVYKCGSNLYVGLSEFIEWYEKNRANLTAKGLPEFKLPDLKVCPPGEDKTGLYSGNENKHYPGNNNISIEPKVPHPVFEAMGIEGETIHIKGETCEVIKSLADKRGVRFSTAIAMVIDAGIAISFLKETLFHGEQ